MAVSELGDQYSAELSIMQKIPSLDEDQVIMELKSKLKPLIIKRASIKRSITHILKLINSTRLIVDALESQLEAVDFKLTLVKDADQEVIAVYEMSSLFLQVEELQISLDEEMERQAAYHFNINVMVTSINQACYEGVNLLNNMITLLIKFRQNKYVLISDIEKAFLHIYLKKESDQNKFCFFWKKDNKIIVYRYKTIIFGLNCSPFILNRVIQHHLNKFPDNLSTNALKNSFYVDNFIYSTSSIPDLFQIYNQSLNIMNAGGFKLQSWQTNNTNLRQLMKTENTLVKHMEVEEKLLGYLYNPQTDTIRLNGFEISKENTLTKRELLSQISSVFDPLSMAAPLTIKGRVLMKQVWNEKTDWDEIVSSDVNKKWQKLKLDLLDLKTINFPRMTTDLSKDIPSELNIFCDASKDAYGFCCYHTEIDLKSNLIFAKCKITPSNKTVPQAELLSVFLIIRSLPILLDSVSDIDNVNIWSDSQIVLEWLLSGIKTKNLFVKNRLRDITVMKTELKQKYKICINHYYVKSEENVADMMTRGIKINLFKQNLSFWLRGPPWLSHRSSWPSHELKCLSNESRQLIQNSQHPVTSILNQLVQDIQLDINPIINIKKYSSLCKLYMVTYYIFKFINKLRHKDVDCYEQAKLYWIKVMQYESFQKEIDYLNITNKGNLVIPPLVDQLNLFKDKNNLLRCKGRLSKLNLYCYNVLNPYLISKTHTLTKLIVEDQHLKCKHLGVGSTLMQIRENGYWITSGRQIVKEIIKGCIICKKLNSFSYNYPKLTNLPKERVKLIRPFLHSAMDYTGHLYIKDNQNNLIKYYILMYTCLGIRAVHIDLLPDLTVNSFLLSFKRFTNSYCIPISIYTDNAKQFITGLNYLKFALNSDEFKSHLIQNSIKHDTIPVYASWVGGVYERQIKTIKQSLYKTVGRAKLDYYQMLTVLSDIQNSINSRPLTYMHSDINEIIAITPNNILKLHNNPRLQLIDNEDIYEDTLWHPSSNLTLHEQLNETHIKLLQLQNEFKKIWYGQYLLSLREINQSVYETNWENKIKVNDIVLVNTLNKPRIYWLMGRVTQLVYSDDGKVRSALIKMPNNLISCHSVKHLYPLEIQATHTGNTQKTSPSKTKLTETPIHIESSSDDDNNRGKRFAAIKCSNLIKDKIKKGLL